MTTARSWIDAYAHAAGVAALSEQDMATILEIAAVAAHGSERMAAPITCWLAASAGLSLEAALSLAHELASDPAGDVAETP